MPIIFKARLTAAEPMTPRTGELHYLACALFEADDDQACHSAQDKPFSIWPPRQAPGKPRLNWVLRAAWLRPDPPPGSALSPDKICIGRTDCAVTEVMLRTATHAQLAAGPVLTDAGLVFASPTYFAHDGATILNPDPRRITESWRRNWNAWLPDPHELRIDDGTWAEISKTVELAGFDLRTTNLDTGHGRDQPGFTGTATLRLSRKATATTRSSFSTLVRFAEFCGTGAQTTQGFGATRLPTPDW